MWITPSKIDPELASNLEQMAIVSSSRLKENGIQQIAKDRKIFDTLIDENLRKLASKPEDLDRLMKGDTLRFFHTLDKCASLSKDFFYGIVSANKLNLTAQLLTKDCEMTIQMSAINPHFKSD